MYTCGILTISDSCFYEKCDDVSGKVLSHEIELLKNFKVCETHIVPDEISYIEEQLIKWVDVNKFNLIITTGGTGFTTRDVTPEATIKVIEKHAPTISQVLLMESLKLTKFAILSRGVSGIRKNSLIINFPGSPKAVKECLSFIAPILFHAIDQLTNKTVKIKSVHSVWQDKISTSVSIMASDVADRSRNSQFPVFSVEDALNLILEKAKILKPANVNVTESLNMVISDIVKSYVNVPPYRASIKDGYAVKFSDGDGSREVKCVSNAGDKISQSLDSIRTCVRISTGARVPDDADAVVQVEDTELLVKHLETGCEKTIDIKVAPTKIGQDIRPIGNDLKEGDVIINIGTIVGPTEIGLMAMAGVKKVQCIGKPMIGILSTGNELIDHTKNHGTDDIIDCNRPLLISLFKRYSFDVLDLGIVPDEPQMLLDKFLCAFKLCDVIITTGSVSMGEKDYIKSVITQDLQADIHFGRIFMKPGKPMTFSTIGNDYTGNNLKLIFSLPGNPVSAFVTSHLFVLPALRKMSGYLNHRSLTVQALLKHDVTLDIRPEYRRCKIMDQCLPDGLIRHEVSCEEFGNQMSSRLFSCIGADGLMCLPPSSEICKIIKSGTAVTVIKIDVL